MYCKKLNRAVLADPPLQCVLSTGTCLAIHGLLFQMRYGAYVIYKEVYFLIQKSTTSACPWKNSKSRSPSAKTNIY